MRRPGAGSKEIRRFSFARAQSPNAGAGSRWRALSDRQTKAGATPISAAISRHGEPVDVELLEPFVIGNQASPAADAAPAAGFPETGLGSFGNAPALLLADPRV